MTRIDERSDVAGDDEVFTALAGLHAFDRHARRRRNLDHFIVLHDPRHVFRAETELRLQIAFGER